LVQSLVRELDPGQNPICHVVWPKKKKKKKKKKKETTTEVKNQNQKQIRTKN